MPGRSAGMPAALQTSADEQDRERLSPPALRAVDRLTDRWALKGPEVAALVGLFKGLHLLFADAMADRWVQLPNKGARGIDGFQIVRRMADDAQSILELNVTFILEFGTGYRILRGVTLPG